ncbi:MAG: hypothetical protein ACP5QP_08040 [Brevinematia bacterium]
MVKRITSFVIFPLLFFLLFNFGFRDYLRAEELPRKPLDEVQEKPEDILKTLPENLPQREGFYIATPDKYIYLDPNACHDANFIDSRHWFYWHEQVYRIPIEKFKGILVVGYRARRVDVYVYPCATCDEIQWGVSCTRNQIFPTSIEVKKRQISPNAFVFLLNEKDKNRALKKVKCFLDSSNCFFFVNMRDPESILSDKCTWLIKLTK